MTAFLNQKDSLIKAEMIDSAGGLVVNLLCHYR